MSARQIGLFEIGGTDCNRVRIGDRTELLGDPKIKPEKPHTIIGFPGGDVEIARTEEGNYWVHVAVRKQTDGTPAASIIRARIDPAGRYADAANSAINNEIAAGDVEHIAFLVRPALIAQQPSGEG